MPTPNTVILPDYPASFVQGRRGEVYVFQGHGSRGQAWSPSLDEWRQVGVDAPTLAPTITKSAGVKFYVARIDITDGGSGYAKPPAITVGSTSVTPVGGTWAYLRAADSPGTPASSAAATAVARIQEGYVAEIEMQSYGKGYTETPPVTLESPPGLLRGSAEVTPADISSSQNNYSVAAGDIYNLTATTEVSITGLTGPHSRCLLRNKGNHPIWLVHQSASSLAANRFVCWNLQDTMLLPGYQVSLTYGDTMQWFASQPEKSTASDGNTQAYAKAIVRAHLRGKYRCYYRYVNDRVPESEGGPIYSDLSPETLVDCGDGKEYITWSSVGITLPPGYFSVELWRTSSDQATTLFRVGKYKSTYNSVSGTWSYAWEYGGLQDSYHDWELMDPDRAGFQAMPILLPNGELNANRFGVPPTNYASAVMFQDRLWMGVDTAGGNPNTLRFSEADEPESMPDVNELILQSNLRSTDHITAIVPYAGAMVVMQSRHCHRLQYVSQPLIDAGVTLLAYRGCLNQRCWDIMDGILYAMDQQGVYAMDPQGKVEDLTLGLVDKWRTQLSYADAKHFMVRADKRNNLIRVSVRLIGENVVGDSYPTRQFVYSVAYKSWWEEVYPQELTCATEIADSNGRVELVYGTSSATLCRLNEGLTDIASSSIASVTITNGGRGYVQPPTVTAPGGHGASFEAAINSDGQVTGILVKTPGTKYAASGSLAISAPPAGGTQATATFSTDSDAQKPVYWNFRSGAFEYTNDMQDKRGGVAQSRQCSVTYRPTQSSCTLVLKTYYNNAKYPRSNVARRDRGVGFTHSDAIPGATLDMVAVQSQDAEAHGVASALFSGRTIDDLAAPDRHISVALSGVQGSAGAVAIHNLDIYGVNDKAGD